MCAREPTYSPLLLVELGRFDTGFSSGSMASSRLPWRPEVAPTMTLRLGGVEQVYSAVAVVYNDGSHWWADMMASGHFKHRKGEDGMCRPCGAASYRYDGLEAGGALRFVGAGAKGITLTSDRQHISVVLYRRQDEKAAARAPAQPAGHSPVPIAGQAGWSARTSGVESRGVQLTSRQQRPAATPPGSAHSSGTGISLGGSGGRSPTSILRKSSSVELRSGPQKRTRSEIVASLQRHQQASKQGPSESSRP
jgi:hypothetical protein